MSGRIFQNVVLQFKETTDRVIGVMDAEGSVIACSELTGIGKKWAKYVEAIELAKAKGVYCVGMTAAGGGKMAMLCDECIAVPAKITARAQEMHILIGHILCELVDGE